MLLGKPLFTIQFFAALGLAMPWSLAVQGKPSDPSPAPPPVSASTSEPPLVTYPPVTPATGLAAHNISELRHLKTSTGSPRLPTPNPWFVLDLNQGTITRQAFVQKLHSLYDPFAAFTPYLDIN